MTEASKAASKRWYREHGQAYYEKNKASKLCSNKKHYSRHAERLREESRSRKKQKRADDPVGYMLENARNRVRYKGLEFSLDRDWLLARLAPMVCEVTGVVLNWENTACVPSLDRKDCTVGYTKENTRVTTWMYNRARGSFSDNEVMEYLVRPLMRGEG